MTAADYNITIDRGFGWSLDMTWQDPNGDPYNLTGWSATMKIRPGYADQTTATFYTLSSTTGEITLGGAEGIIALALSDSQTAMIPAGNAVYDLRMTPPSGSSTKLLEGIAQVNDEVTDGP